MISIGVQTARRTTHSELDENNSPHGVKLWLPRAGRIIVKMKGKEFVKKTHLIVAKIAEIVDKIEHSDVCRRLVGGYTYAL